MVGQLLPPPAPAPTETEPLDQRRAKALELVDLHGRGLEIGPSYNSLVPKTSGARVEIVDHTDRETLVEKYRKWDLDDASLSRIEDVDHIWESGSLLDVIPERDAYDYIVGSHLVEHTVDLIGFLHDCEALLRDGGRLALVVPDKRFCFDRFQPLTSVGGVVDAHHSDLRYHSAGTLLDHQAYACRRDESIAWSADDRRSLDLQFPRIEWANARMDIGLGQDHYEDTHRWKFTPMSFRLIVHDLRILGFHTLEVVGSSATIGFEFFVTLGKGAPPVDVDRMALLLAIEDELVAGLADRLEAIHTGAPATPDPVPSAQLLPRLVTGGRRRLAAGWGALRGRARAPGTPQADGAIGRGARPRSEGSS